MRAREPDRDGFAERNGTKVFYEVFGEKDPTILLLPAWSIVHSGMWRMQVADLPRHFRVITLDGRGNGRSDRPALAGDYADAEFVADAVAVLDAVGVQRAVVVGESLGGRWAVRFAADHPDRTLGVVALAPLIALGEGFPSALLRELYETEHTHYDGFRKLNRHYLNSPGGYEDFVQFFMAACAPEPHSTRGIELSRQWAMETTPEVVMRSYEASLSEPAATDPQAARDLVARVRCPMLVIHGDQDVAVPLGRGIGLAEEAGADLVVIEGAGHGVFGRHPVRVNLLVREFASRWQAPPRPRRRWRPAHARGRRRVLYLSSPLGLGHARRDLAIVEELRKLHPDVDVQWLAQHPVTAMLESRGETIHPASSALVSESSHFEAQAAEHDLHAFQATRRTDDVFLANFAVFHDLVTEEPFDVCVADEAWDIDFFLHENPELKRSPLVWLTDFVGCLPMPEGGLEEEALATDSNLQMIEHVTRFPDVRDLSLFVGNPEDVVPARFGPGMPVISEWVREHFAFPGYVLGFDPREIDREAVRAQLGWDSGERVCLVTAGGTSVGVTLLRRTIEAAAQTARRIPGFRMVVVTGPRIDPASLPQRNGVELVAFVPDLHQRLAACDVAVVQGGLTTCMELAASRRPFVYVPLRNHFEQQFHVPHRLGRYNAGTRLDYEDLDPDSLADALSGLLTVRPQTLPVETDGARRAAEAIGGLL